MWNVHGVMPDRSFSLPFLGVNVDRETAKDWAYRYAKKYVGKPFPNGKGAYSWTAFVAMPVADAADLV